MPDNTANPETPPLLRWREKTVSEPSGFDRRTKKMTRVVEAEGPIPKGATATTDDVCDWTEDAK